MYRSAGNPYVAAAKANIWSQSTQEVLDSWNPFDDDDNEKKTRYQEELDSLDRRRGELVEGIDDSRRKNEDSRMMKADKNLTKKLHATVVFYKTESDRKRRLERRGGHIHPDHYMQGLPIRQGDGTPPSPESELESPIHAPPPPRSKFPFSLFGRKKDKPIVNPVHGMRPASFDDASPRQPIAITNEPHSYDSRLEPTVPRTGHNTYPSRHQDRPRDAYDERIPSKLSRDKHPTSSSRHRDRYRDDHRRRDDRSTSHRDDKYYRSRDVTADQPSSRRGHDKDRSRGGDEYYSSRHRSSRRRHYSDDAGDSADPEARERRRNRHRDRGEYEDSSKHRRHKSEGHHKSRSGKTERERELSHEEGHGGDEGGEAPPPEEEAVEEGGDVLSVSEHLQGSLNVGDT